MWTTRLVLATSVQVHSRRNETESCDVGTDMISERFTSTIRSCERYSNRSGGVAKGEEQPWHDHNKEKI